MADYYAVDKEVVERHWDDRDRDENQTYGTCWWRKINMPCMKNRKELEFISAMQIIRLLTVPILIFYANLASAWDDGILPLPTNDPIYFPTPPPAAAPEEPAPSSQPETAPTHHVPEHGVSPPGHPAVPPSSGTPNHPSPPPGHGVPPSGHPIAPPTPAGTHPSPAHAPPHRQPFPPAPSPNHGSGGNSAWIIACIAIGVIIGAAILIGVAVYICKKIRKRRHGHCGDAAAQEATTA